MMMGKVNECRYHSMAPVCEIVPASAVLGRIALSMVALTSGILHDLHDGGGNWGGFQGLSCIVDPLTDLESWASAS